MHRFLLAMMRHLLVALDPMKLQMKISNDESEEELEEESFDEDNEEFDDGEKEDFDKGAIGLMLRLVGYAVKELASRRGKKKAESLDFAIHIMQAALYEIPV
jgi:hypothetical protein